MYRTHFLLSLLLACVLPGAPVRGEPAYPVAWSRVLSTARYDVSHGVATDPAGNVFISGATQGSIGAPNAGDFDPFLTKYDSSGTLLWSRQFGASSDDESRALAVDSLGNAYIGGFTLGGSLAAPAAGSFDAFVAKYDPTGNQLWARQFGTSAGDSISGMTVDAAGNLYITGREHGNLAANNAGAVDVFVAKYDTLGNEIWTRQLGTGGNDLSQSIAVDATGNLYVAGYTEGNLGGTNAGDYDSFLLKYDSLGSLLWSRQLGTSAFDFSSSVAVDPLGNPYVAGGTSGNLSGTSSGASDITVAKYDSAGNLTWIAQLGTTRDDSGASIALDALGNAYVTGITGGSLAAPRFGVNDPFLLKYDSLGNLLWKTQVGPGPSAYTWGAALDQAGNAFIAGQILAVSVSSPGDDISDAFLYKFAVPEPSSLILAILAAMSLVPLLRRRGGSR